MSTRCAGLASRKAMIGTRLCPPASTRPSCGATSARIFSASSRVFGAWWINGAGFIRTLPSVAGANYLYANDKARSCQTAPPGFGCDSTCQGFVISLKPPNSYLICRLTGATPQGGRGMPVPRFIFAICLAAIVPAAAPALAQESKRPDKVSFYFAAHEDDWQLFMNPSAFEDVIGGASKTVFVHLTAGDAGLGIGMGGRKHPFYLARENGAEAAIRFMASADSAPAERVVAPMTFNGHSIYRVSYRNAVGYFLRVPDGHWTGDGYYETGYESLRRLSTGETDALHAVDGSAVYHGWNDLVATLREIVAYERGKAALIQVNVAETNTQINPQDHSDHLMTAKA